MSHRFPFDRPPGRATPCRPFPRRVLSFASISGPPRLFRGRQKKATPSPFHEPFSIASWVRSLLQLRSNALSLKFGERLPQEHLEEQDRRYFDRSLPHGVFLSLLGSVVIASIGALSNVISNGSLMGRELFGSFCSVADLPSGQPQED